MTDGDYGWFRLPLKIVPYLEALFQAKGMAQDATDLIRAAKWYTEADQNKYREDYVHRGQVDLGKAGEVEIDDDSTVSESGDDGEYVLGWVWVPAPEVVE